MLGISEAAESVGFRTRGYRLTWEQLRDEVPLPCIVHWNQRRFVVVYRVKKRRAWGREPTSTKVSVGEAEQAAENKEQGAGFVSHSPGLSGRRLGAKSKELGAESEELRMRRKLFTWQIRCTCVPKHL